MKLLMLEKKWLAPTTITIAVLLAIFIVFSGGIFREANATHHDSTQDSDNQLLHGQGVILAVARVKEAVLVAGSRGVKFDASNGVIKFRNPDNLDIVPVVTNVAVNNDINDTHFVQDIMSNRQVMIKKTDFDNSVGPVGPANFSIVIYGVR